MSDRLPEILLYLGGCMGCMATIFYIATSSIDKQLNSITEISKKYKSNMQFRIEGSVQSTKGEVVLKKETTSFYDSNISPYVAINPFLSRKQLINQHFA